jgi:hypothetical protein
MGDEQASRNSPDPKFNGGRDVRTIGRALTDMLLNWTVVSSLQLINTTRFHFWETPRQLEPVFFGISRSYIAEQQEGERNLLLSSSLTRSAVRILLSLIKNYSTDSWQLQFQTGPTAAMRLR